MSINGRHPATGTNQILEGANALLGRETLHTDQRRWLTGEHVQVLVSPLESPLGPAVGVVVTVAGHGGQTPDFSGTTVEVVDDRGRMVAATLDQDGNAFLRLRPGPYRLSLRARVAPATRPAVPGGAPDGSSDRRDLDVTPSPSGPFGARRRLASSGLLSAAAAVIAALLVAGVLGLVRQPPAAAEVRVLSATCPPSGRASDEPGRRHVEVATSWGNEEAKRFKKVLDRFVQRTGVNVTLANAEPSTGRPAEPDRDLGATLTSRIERGCAPDIALLPQTGLMRDLKPHLVPIEDVAGGLVDENYAPRWRELGSVDDVLYGVWFKASNKSLIWYNRYAFERAGIEQTPQTWEELKDAAERLLAAGIAPFSVGGKDGWTLTDWFENVYLRTAGETMYESLAKGTLAWTHDSVKHALRTLADILGQSRWLAGGPEGALATSYEDSVRKVFIHLPDPEAAMVFEGDFVASVVDETGAELGDDADFFPFPSIGGSGSAVVGTGSELAARGATGGDVAVLLDRHPASEDLLRYLATPEAAEPWARAGGFVSPNRHVAAAAYRNRASADAAAVLARADRITFDLSDQLPAAFGSDPDGGMQAILKDFLRHPHQVERIAQELQSEAVRSGAQGVPG